MTPTWMRVPSLEEWQRKANDPEFHDARNVGLTDAVRAGWYQGDTGELFRNFQISAEDVVVDVGCGAGGASLFCARYGAQVVYCDLDPGNIESLNERIQHTPAREPRGIVTDCNPLPLAEGFASRVIAMEMLEHVDDPAAILRELARIGKPGALYLISVPDATAERLQLPIAPPEYFKKPNHIHIFEPDELAGKITDAGLEIVERSSYGFFWNLWMCMYWVLDKAAQNDPEAISHDCTKPPYFPLLDSWTAIWARLISLPEAEPLRKALDEALPKSQIFIARKPLS
ncbi:methyltransferase [Halopseudomonas bauzanensis]|nr:methyltransferase [Halopseudomonas bauzanensis]